MAEAVTTKTAPDKGTAQVQGRPKERPQSFAPSGLGADILALHDTAGNQAVSAVLRNGNGRPLDSSVRAFMESRFNHDFSQVRVHTDAAAAQSAEAVNAKAYTISHNMVFGPGEYTPETLAGQHLLAHELAHVVQQRSDGTRPELAANATHEQQAQASASAIMTDNSIPSLSPTGIGLARQQKPGTPPTTQNDDERITRGDFTGVLKELNGMSMEYMLKRLQKIQLASRQEMLLHVDMIRDSLGEKSMHRLAAAIGATLMKEIGINSVSQLDALDDEMDKAELPEGQRAQIRKVLPIVPGGHATLITEYFSNVAISPFLVKPSVAKAFRRLNGLNDQDLQSTFNKLDKSILQHLMSNSRIAESNYGSEAAERLRHFLYGAWVKRFPLERVPFDVGEQENPLLKMPAADKLMQAMRRSISKLSGEAGKRIEELLTPESLAMMATFTAVYVASQVTPVGWVADIIVAGLIVATIAMVGEDAIEIVKELMQFAQKATHATSEKDLDEAAQHFATAVTKVGVDVVMAILFHKAGRASKPYLKPPKTAPVVVDMVTPEGRVLRVPIEAIPEHTVAMEGKGQGGSVKGDTGKSKPGGSDQPKSIQKTLKENRPWSSPEVFEALKVKIETYRKNAKIPRIDEPASKTPVEGGTVAVAKTDVSGLQGNFFGGASPEAIPKQFKGKPGTTGGKVLKPANPLSEGHAEHIALENLRQALEKINPEELSGRRVWVLVEQEPCPSCASGIGTEATSGPIKQFSKLFPQLTIEVQNLRTSRSYVIKNGHPIP